MATDTLTIKRPRYATSARRSLIVKRAPNAMVIRPPEKGGITFEYVANAPGIPYKYKGHYYHLLFEPNGNGELDVYHPPESVRQLPDKLYRALHWDATGRLLATKYTFLEKLNLGLTVVLIAILAFIIFLILNP